MPAEPPVKRTIAFFDGQNLYHTAKKVFGYTYPNYDPLALATLVCKQQGWQLQQTRFYTGIPSAVDDPHWNRFWTAKLGTLGHRGVWSYSRELRNRMLNIKLPDGTTHSHKYAEEKGIDVRIAIDVISMARRGEYDVALVFSQDQDLSEAADEIRVIAQEQGRWIRIASAYPSRAGLKSHRGINHTDWIPIDRAAYDACLDPRNYTPRKP